MIAFIVSYQNNTSPCFTVLTNVLTPHPEKKKYVCMYVCVCAELYSANTLKMYFAYLQTSRALLNSADEGANGQDEWNPKPNPISLWLLLL